MKKIIAAAALAFSVYSAAPADAHFIMAYTPETVLDKGETIEMKYVFTHPFEAGHTMMMDKPLEFFVVNKERKTDLLGTLKQIEWTSHENVARAWETSYQIRGMGDYVFCIVPAPYLEKNEDAYIQQITKLVVNNGSLPTDWDAELGLKAEIVPLDKPYALWTGNVFRGVVKGDGKPVPFAEIEVEYLNYKPDMKNNRFAKEAAIEAPHDALAVQTIKADANGVFTFGIPKAGWWGFAALGVGPDDEFQGKEMSQDALIWIQAVDM